MLVTKLRDMTAIIMELHGPYCIRTEDYVATSCENAVKWLEYGERVSVSKHWHSWNGRVDCP